MHELHHSRWQSMAHLVGDTGPSLARAALPGSLCPGHYAEGLPERGAGKPLTFLEDGLSAAQLGEGCAPWAPGAVLWPGGAGHEALALAGHRRPSLW